MCNIFTSQDPATYAAETRPIRLHGHATSIRLEAAFWDTLEAIAAAEGVSLNRFVAVLHDEILAARGEVPNFASFLRVTCLHWLRHGDEHARQVEARAAAGGALREAAAHDGVALCEGVGFDAVGRDGVARAGVGRAEVKRAVVAKGWGMQGWRATGRDPCGGAG